MNRFQPHHRVGFTLIEMLVVISALAVCTLFSALLILTTLRSEQLAQRMGNRISWRQDLAKEFRSDVARAESLPEKSGELVAGPTVLILNLPPETTVVYRWENQTLTRIERREDQERSRTVPVGSSGVKVEFIRPDKTANLTTLRITESAGNGPPKIADLSAALGGNLR